MTAPLEGQRQAGTQHTQMIAFLKVAQICCKAPLALGSDEDRTIHKAAATADPAGARCPPGQQDDQALLSWSCKEGANA